MVKDRRRRPKSASSGVITGRFEIQIPSRGLVRLLTGVALVLVSCHGVLSVYHTQVNELPWLLIQLFDVDQENNFPTWFSSFLLLTSAALLWLCGRHKRSVQDAWARHWTALALGFMLLSLDEVAGVHETINSVIVMTWAIPAAFAVLVLGLAFLPFLLALPRPTRVLFVVAGAMYVAGGAGLEIVGNDMVSQGLRDTLRYKMTTLAEESLEIFGVILFLHALLGYMAGTDGRSVAAAVEVR